MNNFERYYKAINFLEGLSNLPLHANYMIKQQHLDVYLKRMRYFHSLFLSNSNAGCQIYLTDSWVSISDWDCLLS